MPIKEAAERRTEYGWPVGPTLRKWTRAVRDLRDKQHHWLCPKTSRRQ